MSALGKGNAMSKGYPTRSDQDVGYPILDDVLPEGTCFICKRRPVQTGRGECRVCHAKLHPDEGVTS